MNAVAKSCASISVTLGLKDVAKRMKKLNPFERNNVDRQGLLGIPFLAAISLATAIAGYGVAHQTGIVQEVIEAANETMHYFDGMNYIHYFLFQ